MNPELKTLPSREELVRGLLAARKRLGAEGIIAAPAAADENMPAAPPAEVLANDNDPAAPAAVDMSVPTAEMPQERAVSTEQQAAPAEAPAGVLDHPEVQKGLEQLLSEWDLFKRSGFLGLGAGGSDHPLYKKLAALPVAAVLSGRWEDADQEAITNIQEYMNGWKEQHGIEADPEEAFETYLKRVIANILNIG